MRISRGRLLLRAGLLLAGGSFMLWRAWEARAAAARSAGPAALLAERVGIVQALVGVLALVTAAATVLALRRRERRHSLHLGGSPALPPGDRPRE